MHHLLTRVGFAVGITLLGIAGAGSAHAQSGNAKWESSKEPSGTRYLNYSATVMLLGKPTPILLSFYCNTTHKKNESGALGFDLYVDEVAQLKGFHFDDFEGPDAPTLEKRLLKATIARKGKAPTTFDLSPSGSYPTVTNFVFGVADETHLAKSDAKSLLRALSDDAESLRITITDDRDPKLKLDLTIPIAGKQADFRALLDEVR